MLHTKFGVSWLLGLGEEAKIRYSFWRPSWISDRNDFSYFRPTSPPRCFLPGLKAISLSVKEKKRKIDFKMAAMAAILDFRSERFYLFLIHNSP